MKFTTKEGINLYKTSINIPIALGEEMAKVCTETGVSITAFGTMAIEEAVLKHKINKLNKLELDKKLKSLEEMQQMERQQVLTA
jgi:hypothetical protein